MCLGICGYNLLWVVGEGYKQVANNLINAYKWVGCEYHITHTFKDSLPVKN